MKLFIKDFFSKCDDIRSFRTFQVIAKKEFVE